MPAQELTSHYSGTFEKAFLTYIAKPFPSVRSAAQITKRGLGTSTSSSNIEDTLLLLQLLKI